MGDEGRNPIFAELAPCVTLRDWFAGQALRSKINTQIIGYEDYAPDHRAELIRRIVRDCFEIADAMLRERGA